MMTAKVRFPTLGEIRTQAYQIYLARGSQPNHSLDDWLQAEYELMQLPLHEIADVEATELASHNLKLFSLARLSLTLEKQARKLLQTIGGHRTVSTPTIISPPA